MTDRDGWTSDIHEAEYQHFGQQAEWGSGIPAVYRALAAPSSRPPLPAPTLHDDIFVACAYWTPLLHLLRYTLGWARPDLGLRSWYDAGKPTKDPTLAFIAKLWEADGQLDWFAAWLWSSAWFSDDWTINPDGDEPREQPVDVERDWIDQQRRTADASGLHTPISAGGTDPLHLRAHSDGPLEAPDGSPLIVRTGSTQGRAVLLLDSMLGWYRALHQHGGTLPDLGDRSWHVEVVAKPVGYLGMYRYSRRTGLWFAGRHRFHVLGNAPHGE